MTLNHGDQNPPVEHQNSWQMDFHLRPLLHSYSLDFFGTIGTPSSESHTESGHSRLQTGALVRARNLDHSVNQEPNLRPMRPMMNLPRCAAAAEIWTLEPPQQSQASNIKLSQQLVDIC